MHLPASGALLSAALEPEPLVRRALALLEADFRRLALLALADWERLELPRPELFRAVAALQRPSWGHWNGLLSALRQARKAILRSGSAAERERLVQAGTMSALLDWLDSDADPSLTLAFKPLAGLLNSRAGSRPRLGDLLTLPITLRNLVAHSAPLESAWWGRAADALRAPLEALTSGRLQAPVPIPDPLPEPWFHRRAVFQGVQGNSVLYVLPNGEPLATPDMLGAVLSAFRRLLGRADLQEASLLQLLERLAPEDLKGVLLGDYLVGRPVGEGGFARVHVGTQLSTGRKVAIKVLHDGMREDDRARFQQEAAFLSILNHPNIVAVLGCGEEAWAPPRDSTLAQALAREDWYRTFKDSARVKCYLVMEWVDGKTLEEVYQASKRRPCAVRQVAEWLAQAASALATVHSAGLIHRDVKPSNMMLTDAGRVKLMDFGIARRQDDVRTLRTADGRVLGSPAYAAPEQLATGRPDANLGPGSDIYSLCASFYELFTGRRVFDHEAETLPQVEALKRSGERPARPGQVQGGLPWEIDTILMGGLEPGPGERYLSASDLERDVRHFLRDEPIEYRPPSWPRRLRLWYRRSPAIARLVALLAFLLVAGAVGSLAAALIINEAREQADASAWQEKHAHDAAEESARAADLAKKKAEKAADQEKEANHLAQEARQVAEDQRDSAEWLAYAGQVGLTLAAWHDNNMAHALELHETCQWDLRGWEHDYLTTLFQHQGQRVLRAHHDEVATVCFSPDGQRLASGGRDGYVCVWEAATGKLLWRLEGPVGGSDQALGVSALTFTPDGQYLQAAGLGGCVRIWSCETGKEKFSRKELLRRGEPVFDARMAAFSPDGKKMVGTSGLGFRGATVQVWEALSGRELYTLKGAGLIKDAAESVQVVCFSPDGKQLATAGEEGVKLWNASTGKFRMALPVDRLFGASFSALCFSPDGKALLGAGVDKLQLWSLDAEEPLPPLPIPIEGAGVIRQLAFSRAGGRLGAAGGDGQVHVLQVDEDHATFRALRGHTKPVEALSFSPDGKRLASGGEDGTVRLWSLEDRQEGPTCVLKGHAGKPGAVSFSADGKYLSGVSWNHHVEIYDLEKGGEPARLEGHTADVNAVCFSPDGTRLASASEDGTVLVWDRERGERLATLKVAATHVTALAFDPAGERLAGGDDTGTVRLWALGKEVEPQVLEGHTARVLALCFSDDGSRLAGGSWDATVQVWDLRPGGKRMGFRGHEDQVTAVCFAPGGERLASGGGDATVRVWDLRTQEGVFVLKGHAEAVVALRFSRDGRRLFSAGDRTVRLWDTQRGKEAFVLKGHSKKIAALWLAADGRLASAEESAVRVWNASQRRRVFTLRGHVGWAHDVCMDATGTRLVSAGADGTVRVWDARKGRELFRLEGHTDRVLCVALDSAGKRIASGSDDRSVVVWDVESKRKLCTLPHEGVLRGVCFTPDGQHLATSDGTVRLWDLEHPEKPLLTLQGSTGSIYGMAISPDGKRLAGAGGEGVVWIWNDLERESAPAALKGHAEAVTAVCFSADGRRLASASWDQTARIWEFGKEDASLVLAGHEGRVTAVRFSPDGKRLATAGVDQAVRLWDAEKGGSPVTLTEHTKCVNSVAFAPDGQRLVSAGDDGLLIVWETAPDLGASPATGEAENRQRGGKDGEP